jgi:molecular chaperone GrpE
VSDQEQKPSDAPAEGVDRVATLEADLAKAKSDHLYLMAEFDNYRKRTIKERSDLTKYAGERAFIEMLSVLDNFERAIEVQITADTAEVFKKGVVLIVDEFKSALDKFGVTAMHSDGQAFDPNIHEALGSEESDSVPPGHVTKVFRKPYKLHDKVIRPGQVVVAKPKSAPQG